MGWRKLLHSEWRPFVLLLAVMALFTALLGPARFFSERTFYSVFQHFAAIGLVALGLGLTMIMREFDLSVAGMFGLGGCVAVLCGNGSPWLGVLAALGVGALGGALQALIINRLQLSSVAVSLGGLLTWAGLSYVLTGNRTIEFEHMEVAIVMNDPVFAGLSLRALVTLGCFLLLAWLVRYTRPARELIAAGSDRAASLVAGLNVGGLMVAVFAASGMLSALSGAMLSYGLASATPTGGAADILVVAVAATILGGVSLSGGVGRPLGIAAGVLVLCILRTGLSTLGVAPFVHDIVTGSVLLVVAIVDGEHLRMRLYQLGQQLGFGQAR